MEIDRIIPLVLLLLSLLGRSFRSAQRPRSRPDSISLLFKTLCLAGQGKGGIATRCPAHRLVRAQQSGMSAERCSLSPWQPGREGRAGRAGIRHLELKSAAVGRTRPRWSVFAAARNRASVNSFRRPSKQERDLGNRRRWGAFFHGDEQHARSMGKHHRHASDITRRRSECLWPEAAVMDQRSNGSCLPVIRSLAHFFLQTSLMPNAVFFPPARE